MAHIFWLDVFLRHIGKKAAQNMTAEEGSVRAKKAAKAAAEKRTAEGLAREGIGRERKAAKRS
jgi:hypothetical protein